MLTALATAVGSVPSIADTLIGLIPTILISAFDMPLEVVAMISGVFTFNEMAQTTCNCLGDLAGTVIVAFTGKERELALAEGDGSDE